MAPKTKVNIEESAPHVMPEWRASDTASSEAVVPKPPSLAPSFLRERQKKHCLI